MPCTKFTGFLILKVLALFPLVRRQLSITPDRRKTLSLFIKRSRDLPSKAVLRCMGGDLTAVVASASRRPRPSSRLVKAGSRTVPRVTPAFQSGGSAELQRRCSIPFGSLRLPRVPLGGFATSRPPLAAVAARGAVDNINVGESDPACSYRLPQLLIFRLPLLCITTIVSYAIQDFDTHDFYSPLRGNMGSYVHQCRCMGSLSSTHSPWKVVCSSVNTRNRRNCVKASLPQLRRHSP